jgi:hypothetical protein
VVSGRYVGEELVSSLSRSDELSDNLGWFHQ